MRDKIKFDHSSDSLALALGIDKERAKKVYDKVVQTVKTTDHISQILESFYSDESLNNSEFLYAVYGAGKIMGASELYEKLSGITAVANALAGSGGHVH
jgi:hypothetical protein